MFLDKIIHLYENKKYETDFFFLSLIHSLSIFVEISLT